MVTPGRLRSPPSSDEASSLEVLSGGNLPRPGEYATGSAGPTATAPQTQEIPQDFCPVTTPSGLLGLLRGSQRMGAGHCPAIPVRVSIKKVPTRMRRNFLGDPYGNRTHVTTNGPGSGNLIRTDDIPGMNRLLYQLSYAAMGGHKFRMLRNSALLLYARGSYLSRESFRIFWKFFG